MQPQRNNSMAMISLITGLLGLFGILPLIGSIIAIVTGHMARSQIAADPSQGGDGLATGGLICGYIGFILSCAGLAVAIFVFGGSILMFLGLGAAGAASQGM